ncbi:MAG: MarC family NAAT transporter [Gammaproteobacteria bacterium]
MLALQPWLEAYLTGVVSLFAMMNPPAAVPLYLTLTSGMSRREHAIIARRSAVNAAIVLLICLVAGALVLQFFSISLAALRVAGGMIIVFLGFRLLFAHEDVHPPDSLGATTTRPDPSLVPMAIPTLSGPGSMSVVITGLSQLAARGSPTGRVGGYVVAVLVIVTVAASAWLILRASPRILAMLGHDGIASLKGIMGFILVCIGVQFVANGIAAFIAVGISS